MAYAGRSVNRDLLPYQIVMGVTAAAIGGIIAVLGELRDELGFSETGIGVVVACGFLAAFVSQVTLARHADRGYGREMATIGVALSVIALFAMVFVDGLLAWSLSRALLGFAGGLIMPGLRRAASVLDSEKVGENLGRLIVGEITGFIFGPVISALLVEVGGIRAPFIAFAIGMTLFLPIVMRLPADAGALDEEKRATSFDLLRYPRLQGALILVVGYFMFIGAWESVLPLMFQDRGGSALHTGIAITLVALPIALISVRAGRTADRLGPARVASAGMIVVGVVCTSYGFLPGIVVPMAVMAALGVADGYGFIAVQVAVSRAVPEDRQAGALGLMGATEVLGAGLAAIPAAVLYEHAGARVTWVVIGLVMLAVVGLGNLRLRGTDPSTPQAPTSSGHQSTATPRPRTSSSERNFRLGPARRLRGARSRGAPAPLTWRRASRRRTRRG